jgi:hypothetical protein
MAQQSGGEFASTDPTQGEEDARVQEHGIRAKISVSACRSPQHFQRPTSSYLSKNAPSLQGIGHADVARSRRRGVTLTYPEICYVLIWQRDRALRRDARWCGALTFVY